MSIVMSKYIIAWKPIAIAINPQLQGFQDHPYFRPGSPKPEQW